MKIDSSTLSDLEVFEDATGRGGLFAIVDRTQTKVGRQTLRQWLSQPPDDPRAIRRLQESIRFLVGSRASWSLHPGTTEAVQRYLDSNIQLGRSRPVDWLRLTLWYRDVLRELRAGVSGTDAWLRQVVAGARSLRASAPPDLLRSLTVELLELCEKLPNATHSFVWNVERIDRVYRSSRRATIDRVIEIVGELDALRSMAATTQKLGWTFPEIIDSEQFVLEGDGVFHPFLESPVANPISLTGGVPLVFLTGPNMAGKTTYLRTAALAVLLAQCGMGVPARSLRITPVEVLLTSLNPSDNLRAGLSFFQSEVFRVRDAAAHLAEGRRSFVLFDEVFKGTNVKDALEASATVILGFAKARGSGFIFASHLVELVDALTDEGRVQFHHFEGRLGSGRASYTYEIRPGVSRQRFGLQLLAEAQIPSLLARIAEVA